MFNHFILNKCCQPRQTSPCTPTAWCWYLVTVRFQSRWLYILKVSWRLLQQFPVMFINIIIIIIIFICSQHNINEAQRRANDKMLLTIKHGQKHYKITNIVTQLHSRPKNNISLGREICHKMTVSIKHTKASVFNCDANVSMKNFIFSLVKGGGWAL